MKKTYLKMIQGIKKRGKREWSVYILECGNRTFYTGIAKDVSARIKKHNIGKGAAYTRAHLPVKLIWKQIRLTRSKALILEAKIKSLSRRQKEKFIAKKRTKPCRKKYMSAQM